MSIEWIEALPSDNSTIKVREIRNLLANTEQGLNVSLDWPDGQIRAGAAKSYVSAVPRYGSTNTDAGKIVLESDTSRAFVFMLGNGTPSDATQLLGSPNFIEHADDPADGVWVRTSGVTGNTFAVFDDATRTISFSSTGIRNSYALGAPDTIEYSVPPKVYVSSDMERISAHVSAVTVRGFVVSLNDNGLNASTSRVTIHWTSLGTIAVDKLP